MVHIMHTDKPNKKTGKKDFYIRNKATGNGEIISSTEIFTSKAAAIKNIVAHLKLYNSFYVHVQDNTLKRPIVFCQYSDGKRAEIIKDVQRLEKL